MANAAHASSEIWHRSLEDLLTALETPRAAAPPGPFVINLQTSTTSIDPNLGSVPQFDKLQVYRLFHRGSDGLPQFQLRLGIIESDLEADAILATVRKHYPNATKHAADDTDRAAIAHKLRVPQSLSVPQSKGSAVPPSEGSDTVPMVRALVKGAPPTSKVELKPSAEAARWDIDELLPNLPYGSAQKPAKTSSKPQLQSDRQSGATRVPISAPSGPTHAAAKAAIKSGTGERPGNPMTLRVQAMPSPQASRVPVVKREPIEPQRPRAPVSALVAPLPPVASQGLIASPADRSAEGSTADSGTLQSLVSKIDTLVHAVEAHHEAVRAMPNRPAALVASRPAPAVAAAGPDAKSVRPTQVKDAPNPTDEHRPSIDSTQTVRALTSAELADKLASRWFSIQLMDSQEQIDPEQVPDLDIFVEYRLYSLAEVDPDGSSYMLRLGFFSSELAAQAVASYLAPHFPTTSIRRVSIAEYERFEQDIVTAKKDVGEAGTRAVIEFSAPAPLPVFQPDATTMETPKSLAPDGASMWARLTRRRN
jgi:hypothetical protein